MWNIIRGLRVNTSNRPSSQSNTDSYHNNNDKKRKVIKSTGKFTKLQKLKLVKFPWYSVVRMFTIKFGYNASCH